MHLLLCAAPIVGIALAAWLLLRAEHERRW